MSKPKSLRHLKTITFQKKDKTIFISLNRPEKRNALNPELIQDLLSAFEQVNSDSSGQLVVLSGKGSVFCAGADLRWLSDEKLFNKPALHQLFSLLKLISDCKLPVVAVVHGHAVGGGIGLLSVCDMVIAEENTGFCFSETRLGLVPSIISPFIIRKTGGDRVKPYMLSALFFSTSEAQKLGLVHFTGNQVKCDQYLNKLVNNFKSLDPYALIQTKKLLRDIDALPIDKVQEQCVDLIAAIRKRDSVKQRIKKLFQKTNTRSDNQ